MVSCHVNDTGGLATATCRDGDDLLVALLPSRGGGLAAAQGAMGTTSFLVGGGIASSSAETRGTATSISHDGRFLCLDLAHVL